MSTTQQIYNGRYEIVRPIAKGGMAEVFLAHDQLLNRPVALKVLFPELSRDTAFVERFRREAQNAANLTHPNVVSVYDWGEEGSTYFIVMEYVDGTSVSQQLRDNGPFSPERAASIGKDVALALSFAHEHGVIHRDVKPANILINKHGQVKVTDFGIARARNTEDNLTQTGTVMGTATYFSPEQAQGLSIDGRSDLYALGVVLYEMVTGAPPFSAENPVTVATKHVNEVIVPVREKNAAIPVSLETVIMRALAKSPNDRYKSGKEMAADLDRFMQGKPVMAAAAATTAIPATQARQRYSEMAGTPTGMATTVNPAVKKQDEKSDRYLIMITVLLLLLVGVLFGLWRYFNSSGATVNVPNVIGKTRDEATQIIESNGLKVADVVEQDSTGDPNTVIKQDPNAGTNVKRGSGVTLTVIASRDNATVPDVVGQQQSAAEALLEGLGFEVRVVQENSDQPEGTVIDQSPPKDTNAFKGDTITITVSAGQATIAVPDVSDLTESAAANRLGQAGFNTTTRRENSSNVDKGRVIRTEPPSGSQVKKGSTVVIVISDGPPQPSTSSTSPGSTTTT